MRLFNQILGLTLCATTALAVTYNDVLNNLKTDDAIVKNYTAQLNALTGGPSGRQLIALWNVDNQLQAELNKTTTAVRAATTPSVVNATTIYNYYYAQTPLFPDVKSFLVAYKARYRDFQAAGASSGQGIRLRNLKISWDRLSDSLIAKAPNQDLKTKQTNAKAAYDAAFDQAISAYP